MQVALDAIYKALDPGDPPSERPDPDEVEDDKQRFAEERNER